MEDRIKEIIISVTHKCNLRCAMCQIPLQSTLELSTDELKGLITDAAALCPSSIVFSGGEPLLRSDIFDLIAFANRNKINTCLTSNGTFINDEISGRLASSGLGVINISIEGPEDVHDSLRGSGNFKKAINALECLSHHKVETTVATMICRQNYKFLPYVMELAHKFGVTTVKFQPFSDIFINEKEKRSNFLLEPGEFTAIDSVIKKVIKLAEEYKIATNPVGYLLNVPAYLCGFRFKRIKSNCSSVFTSCPISAEGDVHLCWALSDKIIGNIRENKLTKIWNSHRHNLLRDAALKKQCICMMSCYDGNFARFDFDKLISFEKAKKLKDNKFYKIRYYNFYQSAKYFTGKILNTLLNLGNSFRNDNRDKNEVVREIKIAKSMLERKIRKLK